MVTGNSTDQRKYTVLSFFCICSIIMLVFFTQIPAFGQNSTDNSYWDNIFSRPQRSVAVAVKDPDYAVFAGVFRIPHSPVIGGSDENKFLLSIWDKDHWVLTGQVKEINDYSGSPYITDFDVIRTVAVDQNSIYIGGNFQIITMQGDTCFNIAQWYGDQWHPVEKGIDGSVETIAPTGNGDIYIGGLFSKLRNGTLVNNIVHWNGTVWSTLDDQGGAVGVNDKVHEINVANGSLYVGGEFSTAGGQNVNYIAAWNWGTHAWKALAGGVNSYVRSVATYGSNVYIGGDFTETIGHTSIPHIAKYTDTNSSSDEWSVVGQGKVTTVSDIEISPAGNIYAVGGFSDEVGVNPTSMAMWDGSQWKDLTGDGHNLDAAGIKMAVSSSTTADVIYLGFINNDHMITSDGRQLERYAKWDGSRWHGLGYAIGPFFDDRNTSYKLYNRINDLVWDGAYLYAGGNFQYAGDDSVHFLARWDPANSQWSHVGKTGLSTPGVVNALMLHNNELYIAGDFDSADGISVNNIVKWDGSKFIALGQGVSHPQWNTEVNDITFVNDTLFAVGDYFFDTTGNIAYFDGTSWHPFTSIPSYSSVTAIAYYKHKLYAMEARYVYQYDKSQDKWIEVASDPNSFPTYESLSTDKDYLYLGGDFAQIGNTSFNDIARWDGSTWSAMGDGFDGPVYDVYTNGNDIYASGRFVTSGNDSLWSIALWDSTKWTPLGGGIRRNPIVNGTASVTSMVGTPGGLYAGGTFNYAGNSYSNDLALWKDFTLTGIDNVLAGEQQPYQTRLYPNYPNPFNPATTIPYSLQTAGPVKLRVYNILGKLVATLVDENQRAGSHEVQFNASHLSSGVYFYRISTPGFTETKKLLLLK